MSKMDLTRYRHSLHAHDFTPGGNSRVVMIRKKEQRTFTSNVNGQEPKIETLTKETVQTFRGNKIERKVTSQKKDSQNVHSDIMNRINLITINGSETPKKSAMGTSVTSMIENEDRGSIRRKPKVSFSDRSFMDKFAQDCLEAHNDLRSMHMSPPLRLSKKLSKYSEEWARSLAARGEMQHRAESCYGENIFQVWSSNPDYVISGNEVVQHWYAEMKDHVFGVEPTTLKTGHFTQVVWTESTDLGVGVAKSRTGQIFVVCNYDPPGNFIGSFKDNVPPIGGFADSPRMVTNDKEFQEEALRFHNQYRSKHGAPPLILSNHLSKYAQEWAERMAKEDKMYHRPGNQFGENIYSQYSSSDATAKDAVSSWYQEGKNYTKYSAEPRNPLHTGAVGQPHVKLRRPSEFMKSPRPQSCEISRNSSPKPAYDEAESKILKRRSNEYSSNTLKLPTIEVSSGDTHNHKSSASDNLLDPLDLESKKTLKRRSSEYLCNALKLPSNAFFSNGVPKRRSSAIFMDNLSPSSELMANNTWKRRSSGYSNDSLNLPDIAVQKRRSSAVFSGNLLKPDSVENTNSKILERRYSEIIKRDQLRPLSNDFSNINHCQNRRSAATFDDSHLKPASNNKYTGTCFKSPSKIQESIPTDRNKLPTIHIDNYVDLKTHADESIDESVRRRQPSHFLEETLTPWVHSDQYWKQRRSFHADGLAWKP